MLAEVAGESLIIVRDGERRLHAFYNVCRHRGSRMCEADRGRFAGSIQCPYHGWTYGLDGRLKVARNMSDVPEFAPASYPLLEASIATWGGFVFVNLAPRPAPLKIVFAPLLGRFSRCKIAALVTARSVSYDLACRAGSDNIRNSFGR